VDSTVYFGCKIDIEKVWMDMKSKVSKSLYLHIIMMVVIESNISSWLIFNIYTLYNVLSLSCPCHSIIFHRVDRLSSPK